MFSYLFVCSFVFCNYSHGALSSTMLFPSASVCVSAHALYMNFTIGSIDVSLFGTSCDVYSLKSLYDSLYNDKMLLKLYVYMFFFCFLKCSHTSLSSYFCCSHEWVVGGALVHEFLISYSHAGWCFQARAWVLHFQRVCSWSFVYEFHHFTIRSTDDSLFDISCNAYSLRCIVSEKAVWLVVKWQNV